MPPRTAVAVTSLVLSLALVASCKRGDEFENAPSANAPEEPLVTKGAAGERQKDRSRGQVPAGHPPVGGEMEQSGGSPSGSSGGAGGGAPAGDRGGGLPVDWKVPGDWKQVPPSSKMRAAEYEIPGPEGTSPATLAVYHFPGGGGKVQANIDRWTGQFEAEQGEVDPQTEVQTVGGLKVHTVDLSGTFNAGVGMGSGEPKENHRMLAAIAETDGGKVIFKMVGPAPTVAEHAAKFDKMVSSLQPGG